MENLDLSSPKPESVEILNFLISSYTASRISFISHCSPKMAQIGPRLILAWLLQFYTWAFLHWSKQNFKIFITVLTHTQYIFLLLLIMPFYTRLKDSEFSVLLLCWTHLSSMSNVNTVVLHQTLYPFQCRVFVLVLHQTMSKYS